MYGVSVPFLVYNLLFAGKSTVIVSAPSYTTTTFWPSCWGKNPPNRLYLPTNRLDSLSEACFTNNHIIKPINAKKPNMTATNP